MNKKFDISKEKIQEYLDKGLTYKEMAAIEGCNYWRIMAITRSYGLRSNARAKQQRENNVAKNPEVKKKISDSVKQLWQDGIYKDRVNGMLGVTKLDAPNYIPEEHYREKLIYYNNGAELVCSRCGKPITDGKIDVHHVDENRKNNLLSNLEPLCNVCHQLYHINKYKQPFVMVTSTFKFDSAHFVPNHPKKCKFLHGHSYKLEVTVRRRIDPYTGMAIDFGKLKSVVNKEVCDVLDHAYLNNYIEIPTSENIVVWIWEQLSMDIKGLYKLRLYETENNFSEITVDEMLEMLSNIEIENEWLNDEKVIENKSDKQTALKDLDDINKSSSYLDIYENLDKEEI